MVERFGYLGISTVSGVTGLACRFAKEMHIGHSIAVAAGVWVLGFFIRCIWVIFLYPIYFSPLIGLPEPREKNHWLMGQYPSIRHGTCGSQLRNWTRTVPNNGIIRYRTYFNSERLLFLSPSALRQVLIPQSYNFTKSPEFSWVIKPAFGNSIIVAKGNAHRYQRKHLAPAFSFRQIQDMIPAMWSEGIDAVNHLTRKIHAGYADQLMTKDSEALEKGGEPWIHVDMMDFLSRTSLSIISTAGMGLPMNAVTNPDNELYSTYSALNAPARADQYINVATALCGPWVKSLPFSRNRIIHAAGAHVRSVCRGVVTEKRERIKRGEDKSNDMVLVILERSMFSVEEVVDQVMTFLLAGHETTATAIQWVVWILAAHPVVVETLRVEIRTFVPPPDSDTPFDPTALSKLHYLQAVIHETLRLIPPVPWLERCAAVDTVVDGVVVPRGTKVAVAPWAINGNPGTWGADVDVFRPERWLTGEGEDGWDAAGGAGTPYASGAFLHGPRGCLGMGFAKGEMGCVVGLLAGRFRFELVDRRDESLEFLEYTEMGRFFSRVQKGMNVKVSVVEGW